MKARRPVLPLFLVALLLPAAPGLAATPGDDADRQEPLRTDEENCAEAGPTSVFELAVGYTVVRSKGPSPVNAEALPVGWSIGFAAKLTQNFGVVSELSAAYDSESAIPPATHRTAVYFLNGLRVMAPIERVTFFGEALAGVAHDRDFRPLQVDKNRFVVRPGAGVDFRLSTNVSFRFQAGWTIGMTGTTSPDVFQLTTGLVFGR